MSWFRKQGKYWLFVRREEGKERSYYIGDDEAVVRKLLSNKDKLAKSKRKKPPTERN